MRSSTVVALFAGAAAAQSSTGSAATGSSAVVVNGIMPAPTLTVIGSSSGTTTYVNSCTGEGIPASFLTPEASGSASSSLISSVRSPAGTLAMSPISAPATTAAARLRRQDDGGLFGGFCEPITIKQGPSSVQIHLEDPTKGAWTADMNCAWKGELTTADLTCTGTQSGTFAELNSIAGVTSEIIKASDASQSSMIQTVSVVQPASNSASPTASVSQSDSANTTASGSGTAAATGAAAGTPLPGGMMAFVAGAAGMIAAALTL
ncbi:hypothetical protein C7974DRAFT_194629 [Boeremia exigua]|uniref:uncharacterized protein n=1 Tax=Boeremia exigua TaxID=749465 RepID=UPI001E8CED8A|nr:uncharacterized protein C7974DRAFT_194629 [Boeremia exigua]KAH6629859.1 hypothetical protein C7974DRAFT_194629 [Boeremia exigua]